MDYKTGILLRNTQNYLNNYSQKLLINNSFNINGTIQSVTQLQDFYLLTNSLNLQCGDYVETESKDKYLIIDDSDIQTDIGLSKYLIQKINADIIFCKSTDTAPHLYSSCIKVNSINIDSGQVISVPDGNIDVYLPLDKYSNQISLNDTFCAIKSGWKIIGLNTSKVGIIILTCEKVSYSENDDKTYEFVNRWIIDLANKGTYIIAINEIENEIISNTTPIQLGAVVTKDGIVMTNAPVKWELSNDTATINSNGLLTPLYNGSCIIKATYNDKFGIPYCAGILRVQINGCKDYYYNGAITTTTPNEPNYTEIVTNDVSPIDLKQNNTYKLTATTNPTGGIIIYSSSDTNIATVDATGLITAVGIGNATMTESINGTNITKAFTIGITGAVNYTALTEYLSKPICVGIGTPIKIPAPTTTPTGGTITYATSNNTLATIDSNGNLTGVAVGTPTVTFKIKDSTITRNTTCTVNSVGKSLLMVADKYAVVEQQSINISAISNPIGEKVNFSFVGSSHNCGMSITDTTCTVKTIFGSSGSLVTVRGTLASNSTIYTDYTFYITM